MKRIIATAILAFALVGSAVAAPRLDSCCCIEQDGELVCTVTGDTMSVCCCD